MKSMQQITTIGFLRRGRTPILPFKIGDQTSIHLVPCPFLGESLELYFTWGKHFRHLNVSYPPQQDGFMLSFDYVTKI